MYNVLYRKERSIGKSRKEVGEVPVTVTVLIPQPLRRYSGNRSSVVIESGQEMTLRDLLDLLEQECSGIKERIIDEQGEQNRLLNLYVNREDVRYGQGLDTPIPAGAEVSIITGVAGG